MGYFLFGHIQYLQLVHVLATSHSIPVYMLLALMQLCKYLTQINGLSLCSVTEFFLDKEGINGIYSQILQLCNGYISAKVF